jgi:hypothetical protein
LEAVIRRFTGFSSGVSNHVDFKLCFHPKTFNLPPIEKDASIAYAFAAIVSLSRFPTKGDDHPGFTINVNGVSV